MNSTLAKLSLVATAIVTGVSSTTAQATASLITSKDTTLYESATGALANGGGVGMFCGRVGFNGGFGIRRTMVQWDIVGSIPAGSQILTASFDMWVEQSPAFLPIVTEAHRITTDWSEGNNVAPGNGGSGGPNGNGESTWIHSNYPSQFWNTPGGDFAPTSFTFDLPGIGAFATPSNAAFVADVQDMLDNPSANFGWLLKTDELLNSTARRINTREAAAFNPKLVITYLAPGTVGTHGVGWPVNGGTFQLNISGTANGGDVVPITWTNAPTPSFGVNFFTIGYDPIGTTFLPNSALYLPLAAPKFPGPTIAVAGGTASSTFTVPVGFPGFLIAVQGVALDSTPLNFSMSNAGLIWTN
ncbi:MAG: hypothetical protein ACI89X_002280 [Planctomycetota bacterium]|jgi:hypothetical protein